MTEARWAPSGDNGQPWRIRPGNDDHQASVSIDDSQPRAFLDYQGEASKIAIGCFLENLRVLATRQQHALYIDNLVDTEAAGFRADISLDFDSAVEPDPLADFVRQRHSNRKKQVKGPLTPNLHKSLLNAGNNISGVDIKLYSDPSKIGRIADAVAAADHVRFMHEQCHKEFHEKVRWTESESATGFSPATFEINLFEQYALKFTANYERLQAAERWLHMGRMVAKAARKQVLNSSTIGIITGDPNAADFWLNAGRALQRVWLQATVPQATNRQLGFQVLAVAPILSRRFRLEGSSQFDQWQMEHLGRVDALLQEAFHDQPVGIMFRVGLAKKASAKTGRLACEELMVSS